MRIEVSVAQMKLEERVLTKEMIFQTLFGGMSIVLPVNIMVLALSF